MVGTEPVPSSAAAAAGATTPHLRVKWEIKALLPIAFVLLNGLLLFLLTTLSIAGPTRHAVLVVAVAGAVAICAVLLAVLYYLVQRPMSELQEKMARVTAGDLTVAVDFTNRNDEIGDLGRNFNTMTERLRENRDEIERLHRTQMSRAEHLATLGELAAGLAHEIRNPLAGIAGVIDIIGRDLPATSPARQVVKEVRQEITQINRIITDLLETARPKPPDMHVSDLNATVEHSVMLGRVSRRSPAPSTFISTFLRRRSKLSMTPGRSTRCCSTCCSIPSRQSSPPARSGLPSKSGAVRLRSR